MTEVFVKLIEVEAPTLLGGFATLADSFFSRSRRNFSIFLKITDEIQTPLRAKINPDGTHL
jgi:hypothetical protein